MEQSLFAALGGAEDVLQLANAWHKRVLADEEVSHAFSHGYHPQHVERLAAYWGEAWGGPPVYSQQYGSEASVVRMHSCNGPHEEMDRRAIECFDQAMEDVGVESKELRQALHDYFSWMTKTTMTQYPENADNIPPDLKVPRWSWDGLER